jgi:hypothetical protein
MTMSRLGGAPPKVSKELKDAFYDDWKRQAVDSAKKRAVAQYADYDTFKNMVSVAHLKAIGEKSTRAGTNPRTADVWTLHGHLVCLGDLYTACGHVLDLSADM